MTDESIDTTLRDALANLYNPDFQPSEALYALTGCLPQDGVLPVQARIIRAIEALQTKAHTLVSSRLSEIGALLHNRFVLQLTLDETAERMHSSSSTTWRTQRVAIHTLARALWECHCQSVEEQTSEQSPQSPVSITGAQASDWQSQTKRELEILQASGPGAVARIGAAIDRIQSLGDVLFTGREVGIEIGSVQPDLTAAIHPAQLRQILIAAIGRLARYTSKAITVFARLEGGHAKITLTGSIDQETVPTREDLMRDLLLSDGVSAQILIDSNHVFLWLTLPAVGTATVLAVDDNLDMCRFYERCTEGTRYHVIHTGSGKGLLELVAGVNPVAIVLDVMLPDINGWEMLIQLHDTPATRAIPVLVCSVVHEEELALSLGAAAYLSKPVQPNDFISALDQVVA